MLCYRDITFCTCYKDCKHGKSCNSAYTEQVKADAKKWWGSDEAPVSLYVGEPECFVEINKLDEIQTVLKAKKKEKCSDCGGELKLIKADEPWHPEHYQCINCNGTFCTFEDK